MLGVAYLDGKKKKKKVYLKMQYSRMSVYGHMGMLVMVDIMNENERVPFKHSSDAGR